jgi:auxin efflux carrier family protein
MSAAHGDLPLGEVIYTAVKPIFKIYLIIGVGYYLARKNILTVETSKNISTIAIRVLIPCLTFQKIVTNINNRLIHEIATIVIIAYFMMFS